MDLPEWCQTHSLIEFFELVEDFKKEQEKGNTMNEVTQEDRKDVDPVVVQNPENYTDGQAIQTPETEGTDELID